MDLENELDIQIRDMRARFLVPPSTEEIFAEFDAAIALIHTEYQTIANAFRHNVSAALSTVTVPFALASTSVEQSHFQRIHIAERIRARSIEEGMLKPGESMESVREQEAYTKAHLRMHEFIQSDDGRNVLIQDICTFLLTSLVNGLESAAQELLHQGVVLLWSAFEVLCRDTFESLLNEDPAKVQALVSHPITKKRFEAEKVSLDTLAQYGFDISTQLGTILVRQHDFSDLPTIKAVYSVLFPNNADLNEALTHHHLWMLYQRRHLVVHRRGVIDQNYIKATGESLAAGTRLNVSPQFCEDALKVVVSACIALVRSLPADVVTQ